MSLLEDAMVSCHMLDKKTVPDGYGGYTQDYTEGVQFLAAINKENSIQSKIAEVQGVRDLYTITVKRELMLDYHDCIVRDSDNKVFRVTSNGIDNESPKSSTLNMRVVSAEEWNL